MAWIKLIKRDEVRINSLEAFLINGEGVLVVNFNGVFYAYKNNCTHADVPLSIGWLTDDGKIVCAMHHAIFNAQTGQHIEGPGGNSLKFYNLREIDEWVEIFWETKTHEEIVVKSHSEANRASILSKIRELSKEYQLDDNNEEE